MVRRKYRFHPDIQRLNCEQLEERWLLAAGDFNRNGTVDAADFVVWRKTMDTAVEPYTAGDADGNGRVETADYGPWRANFGSQIPTADLEIVSIIDSPDPVAAGDTVIYTVTVINRGVSPASAAQLDFNAGEGLIITSITSSIPTTSIYIQPGGAAGVCDLAGPIPVGLSFSATVEAAAYAGDHDAAFDTQFVATVSLPRNDRYDPNESNNKKDVITTITLAMADLEVRPIQDEPDPVQVGQLVAFNVTIVNNGPSTAKDVSLRFQVGGGLQIQSIATPQGYALPSLLYCYLDSIPKNAAVIVQIVATTNDGGGNSNFDTIFFASIDSATRDPHPLNNLESATTKILVTAQASGTATISSSEEQGSTSGFSETIARYVRPDSGNSAITSTLLTPTSIVAGQTQKAVFGPKSKKGLSLDRSTCLRTAERSNASFFRGNEIEEPGVRAIDISIAEWQSRIWADGFVDYRENL
jgi:hypothetical protein